MTKEQEQLVIDNHNLIYYFINKWGVSTQEFYDVCALGLCKAAISYNPKKDTKFVTYAGVCIENAIRMELRASRNRTKYLREPISLSSSINEDFSIDILENISNGLDAFDYILPYNLKELLTSTEYKIVSLTIAGSKQTEISDITGFSQSYISRILKSVRKKIGGK